MRLIADGSLRAVPADYEINRESFQPLGIEALYECDGGDPCS
jgi:hypothetical protein